MPSSAADIGAILLLVLPGFLAYRFALARRADPARRSPLWQLAEILEYSVYVHVAGVGLVFGLAEILQSFGIDTHLDELPRQSPPDFLGVHFVEGMLLFTLYPVYVVFAAMLMGAYDLPSWVTSRALEGTTALTKRASSTRFLRWVPSPRPAYPPEPVWYRAFHQATDEFREAQPLLLVKMKRGDIYYGELASYPVLPDNENKKDFLIRNTRYYPGGDLEEEYRLEEQDGVGAVLLNTANVESIQVYYDWVGESDLQHQSSEVLDA